MKSYIVCVVGLNLFKYFALNKEDIWFVRYPILELKCVITISKNFFKLSTFYLILFNVQL